VLAHQLLERARAFDKAVDEAVARRRSPGRDRVFYSLSSAADHSLLWVALAAVREATGWGRHGSTVRLTAALTFESALTNVVLKGLVGRLRPAADAEASGPLPHGLRRPVTSAFPSGHATAAFTAAAFLSRGDPLGPAYYALAVLVAASRVYVRLHHASDVLAGVVLGMAFGRVARRFAPLPPPLTPPG